MTGSRLRGVLLGTTALLAGGLLLVWSQPWYTLELVEGSGSTAALLVGGDVAAAGLAPLALTLLALIAALAISGRVFRIVLGVLESLLGGVTLAVASVTVADPVRASASAVTEMTGVSGQESVAALVQSSSATGWPVLSFVLGVLVVLAGAAVAVTASRWPVSGRKYSRARLLAQGDDENPGDPIAEWDALSDGDDPTAPAR